MNKTKIFYLLATAGMLTLSACGGDLSVAKSSESSSVNGQYLASSTMYEIGVQAMENRDNLLTYSLKYKVAQNSLDSKEAMAQAANYQASFYKDNVVSGETVQSYAETDSSGATINQKATGKLLLWVDDPLDPSVTDKKQMFYSQNVIYNGIVENNYVASSLLDEDDVDEQFYEKYLSDYRSTFQGSNVSYMPSGELTYMKVSNKKIVGSFSGIYSVGSTANPKYPSDTSKYLGVWVDVNEKAVYEKDSKLGWVCTGLEAHISYGVLTDNDFNPLDEMIVLQEMYEKLDASYCQSSKLPSYKGKKIFDATPAEDLSSLSPEISISTDGSALDSFDGVSFSEVTYEYNTVHGTSALAVFSTGTNTVDFEKDKYYGVTTAKAYAEDPLTLTLVDFNSVTVAQSVFAGNIEASDVTTEDAPTFFKASRDFSAYVTVIYNSETDIQVILTVSI